MPALLYSADCGIAQISLKGRCLGQGQFISMYYHTLGHSQGFSRWVTDDFLFCKYVSLTGNVHAFSIHKFPISPPTSAFVMILFL